MIPRPGRLGAETGLGEPGYEDGDLYPASPRPNLARAKGAVSFLAEVKIMSKATAMKVPARLWP